MTPNVEQSCLDALARSLTFANAEGDPVAALSHALRTPLTTVRAVVGILRDYPELDRAERERFLAALVQDTERLTRVVNRLLAILSA